ncbi:hypothetical protein GN244_ATG09310 [Phytophthora infestans]|uniref:Secreted RxLR effector peptide protein n=1 Tax=Phytophthora infestans TaxID=4787 RepID=A0A833T759_PHYIN|nr:hypothetical protein GN244_ATG09310 [Phytophthora infestans]KAF4134944.1 hypothetical protein GN958_ATG15878 [Phytophthora infestans]
MTTRSGCPRLPSTLWLLLLAWILYRPTSTCVQDKEKKDATARKNEMAIRSFRLFESHRKIRRLRVPMAKLQLLKPLSRGATDEICLALHRNTQVTLKQ